MSAGTPERAIAAVVDAAPDDEPLLERLCELVPTRIAFGLAGPDEIVARAADAEVLATLYTYTYVTCEVLEALPRLRMVATRTVGYSHIDVEAAAARGIAVSIVPTAMTEAVAEYLFGSVLALGRRLADARESTRAGEWEFRKFRGFELAGKTLGIVGLGAIGSRVAEIGRGFGMDVVAWTRRPKGVPGIVEADLEHVLARADVLCVSVALNAETQGLLDDTRLALLKPEAVLVNVARGGILDEEALIRRLEDGLLGGACLDVLATEPPERATLERLARLPNVLVTPHIAWHTSEALARQFAELAENIAAFVGGRPRNLVEVASAVG